MFDNTNLKNLLETSSTIQSQSAVIAEWNLNTLDNVDELGNYRYRPSIGSPTTANFGVIQPTYTKETSLTSSPFYYGATDSNVSVDGGFNINVSQQPVSFISLHLRKFKEVNLVSKYNLNSIPSLILLQ